MIGIYKITNPKGKSYIGKTKDWERRIREYKKIYCHQQKKIYHSLKKYGSENHTFEIIEECEENQLNEREIYWISSLNSVKKGLNLTYGGDGGNLSKESLELRRLSQMKPILQYDLEGNFVKKHRGASEACKSINKKNGNNINDCARGKYKSTYGFQWVYEEGEIKEKIDPIKFEQKGAKWTEERRVKTKQSRKGEKRSKEYSEKISELKRKPIYQYDIHNKLTNIFPSFRSMDGSGYVGTTKLRKIINKDIYFEGYKYSYTKLQLKYE